LSLLDELDEADVRTRLEFFIVTHEVKPAHLAREAGISRQHLLRVRKGIMEPTRWKIAQIVSALRRMTLLDVQASELFELSLEENGLWALARVREDVAARTENFRERMRATAAVIARILGGAQKEWARRFLAHGVSEALVRQLVLTAHRLLDDRPARAIAILDVAERLTIELPALMKRDVVIVLRGRSCLDRAFALRSLGRFNEARTMLDRAEAEFQKTPYCTHELAQTWYERAAMHFKLRAFEVVVRFAQQARSIFILTSDRRRAAKARMIEGCVLADRGELAAARDEFRDAVAAFAVFGDRESAACAHLNLGSTEMRLGHLNTARGAFRQAAQEFVKLGMHGEAVRARWNEAHLVAFHENLTRGLVLLRKARSDFANLEMLADSAFVGLDMLKALFGKHDAAGEAEQVARVVFREFELAGVTKSALEALAYLRDAIQRNTATGSLVDDVRSFIELAQHDAAATFSPPS